jgi:hypothetical protein
MDALRRQPGKSQLALAKKVAAATTAQVTATSTSGLLAAAVPNMVERIIQNTAASTAVTITYGVTPAVAGVGLVLAAGATHREENYIGALYCVTASGTAAVTVVTK